jgi:hypothetical protein
MPLEAPKEPGGIKKKNSFSFTTLNIIASYLWEKLLKKTIQKEC